MLARHAGDPHVRPAPDTRYRFVAQAPADFAASAAVRPVVVGFGPCGLFAALLLAQMGLRPIVLERGRAVRERTRDTWGLWRRGVLDPESNVQFGEGGAGTFSDGKLWSQISDPRHLTRKVIDEFVKAGAPEEIAWVAKPHIGTFRLVGVVEKMRAEIERARRRDPLRRARRRPADRGRPGARPDDRARHGRKRAPRSCAPTRWCSPSATAPATPSPCCTSAAWRCRPSRSRSAFASSIRRG